MKPELKSRQDHVSVAECKDLGVQVEILLPADIDSVESVLDKWVAFVESRVWLFGGGVYELENRVTGFLCAKPGNSLTELDRSILISWLHSQSWVQSFTVGELTEGDDA